MPHQRKCDFLELEPRHICGQCNNVLLDPVQLPCGHLICERCMLGLFGDEIEVVCKTEDCGTRMNKNEVFPDNCSRREIRNLKVYCTNKGHGCEEVIPWKMLQDHIITDCKYAQRNTHCMTEHANPQDEQNQRGDHDTHRKLFEGGDQAVAEEEEEEGCDEASIREDFETLRKNHKEIREHVKNVEDQNKEVQDALHKLQNKITLTGVRLDKLVQLQHHLSVNRDGMLVWKIENYTRKRQDVDHGINSGPFYCSCFGYKMCGRVYLNGDGLGRGTHLSFFFVIMKGEYDALLPWPFTQDVTLMLLDQDKKTQNVSETIKPDPDSSSFRRPETEMNIASGCPLFVEHSVLETPTYLQDDTIYLRINVNVDNIPDGAAASDKGQGNDVEGVEEEGP